MAKESIIGAGNMGNAIAAVVGKGGHTVELIGYGDHDTPANGEVVVLAVPTRPWPTWLPGRATSWPAR